METSLVDLIWKQLQAEIARVQSQAKTALVRSERSERSGGMEKIAYGVLPHTADGANDGDTYLVTNGRKVGEAVGAGTGVPAYFCSATDTWYRFADDTAVSI